MKTTTQKTELPPMSEQEKQLLDLMSGAVLPAYLEEAGYDVTTTEISYEESASGKALAAKLADLKDQKYKLEHGFKAPSGWESGRINSEISKLEAQIAEEKAAYTPTYDYNVTKRVILDDQTSKALQATAEKYGKDSAEYKAQYDKLTGEQQTELQKNEIQKLYMDRVQKFLSGDLSITPEQEQFIKDQMAPIKAAVDSMYEEGKGLVNEKYDNFIAQVKETKMSVSQALDVVGTQIEKTGADMEKALTSTIAANRELMKMGIEDATGEITKKISMQAIATGRDPSDPEYSNEIQTNIARQVKSGELAMTAMEAEGKMGIAERTGSGLESIAQARVRLEEATGGKMEGAAMGRGGELQALSQAKGESNIRLAETGSNLRQQLAIGLPPQQISVGSGYQQLQEALVSQRMANAGAPMGVIGGLYGTYANERYAQPTTTTSQPWGFDDYLSAITGVAGGAALAGYGISSLFPAGSTPATPTGGTWT